MNGGAGDYQQQEQGQILTISKDRLARRLGRIEDRQMQRIEEALHLVLGLQLSSRATKRNQAP